MIDIDTIENTSLDSSHRIQKFDLKNRKKFPRFPTRVIDDFFLEPHLWRNLALQQEYNSAYNTTFPGKRSKPLAEINEDIFGSFCERLLHFLPQFNGFYYCNASFFCVDESFIKGWVHDDDPDTTFTGIIYLNQNPPINSGTTMYDDRFANEYSDYHKLIQKDCLESTPEERQTLSKHRDKQRSCFVPSINVDNVYNRCVLFDPKTWHSADNFFGTTLEDSRMTLVFYAQAGAN